MWKLVVTVIVLVAGTAQASWLTLSDFEFSRQETVINGPSLTFRYTLRAEGLSPDMPAYIFFRVSRDAGETWQLVRSLNLQGNGHGIVHTAGPKEVTWWGIGELGFDRPDEVRVKGFGIRMSRIPGGSFAMKAAPGGGHDDSRTQDRVSSLPLYFAAIYETTVAMYSDYLNEVGGEGAGWDDRMSDPEACGIRRIGSGPPYRYEVLPGRGEYPVNFVSWYDALAFAQWCGLSLPSEAEFEKAFRGGIYLDGDKAQTMRNLQPERIYPWGDDPPAEEGVYRCNLQGADDGFEGTAPVGSFSDYCSPYGVCDLAGNVAEWTLDWYSTTYHAGLDGYRMVRGGSWRSFSAGVDAISGATSLPVRESAIMGFRTVFRKTDSAEHEK